MEEIIKKRLEIVNNHIEIYKKNTIDSIKTESIIPATNYLLTLRDLKEQQLLLEELLDNED